MKQLKKNCLDFKLKHHYSNNVIIIFALKHFFRFYLFLNNHEDRNVLSKTRRLKKLPNIEKLSIDSVLPNDVDVNMFLKYVAPQKLQKFIFGGDYNKKYFPFAPALIEIEYYSKALYEVVKSTLNIVVFKYCSFSSSELQSVFSHATHTRHLGFSFCRLGVDYGFDIKEQDYNLEYLWLYACEKYSGWEDNLDNLKILVKAIAYSSLRKSLKTIGINKIYRKLDKEKVREIFKRFGIQDLLYPY